MTFEEFEHQAATATMIPLRRELLADLMTPVSAYMMLRSPESPSIVSRSERLSPTATV